MAAKPSAISTPALLLTLLLAATGAGSVTPVANLPVQVTDVTDTRSLSSFSADLTIDVRVSGPALAGAQAFRTSLERASDYIGLLLLPAKGPPQEFTTLEAAPPTRA